MSVIKEEDPLYVEEDEEVGDGDEEFSEVFVCKYCNFQTTDIDDLDEHIITHQEALIEDVDEEPTEFETPEETAPPLKFTFAASLVTPNTEDDTFEIVSLPPTKRKRAPMNAIPAFFEESSKEKTVFVCPYCAYQTMRKGDMNKHLLGHKTPVEVPMYKCSECPYQTRRKCDMPKHLLTHCKDGNVPMFKCPHCPYATKRKNDLPKHMLCHEKIESLNVYECHRCNYTTKRKGDLKKHLLSHENDVYSQGGAARIFNCTECGYSSKRLNDLHKHVILHCDRKVKGILKCPKCDYATDIGNHFARHILSGCDINDTPVSLFPKDPNTREDYIVLQEDDLHLYELDKESIDAVKGIESQGNSVGKKRKRVVTENRKEDIRHFYEEEETEVSTNTEKVVVLAGYDKASG